MTYIVKNKKNWLDFDSFVDSDTLQIMVTCEPVGSPLSATEFFSESSAKLAIDGYERTGGDISDFTIHDKEHVLKEMQEEAERKATELIKETWNNTSEEKKKEMLAKILEKDGTEGVVKWLEQMGETNTTIPEATTSIEEDIMTTKGILISETCDLPGATCTPGEDIIYAPNNTAIPESTKIDLLTTGPLEFEFTFNGVTQLMEINNLTPRSTNPNTIYTTVRVKDDPTCEAWMKFFPKALKKAEPREYIEEKESTYDPFLDNLEEATMDCIRTNVPSLSACKEYSIEESFLEADQLEMFISK